MHGEIAVFTVIAKNYLPYARVLMRSVVEHHPDWKRFVVLTDLIDGYFDPCKENFHTVLSRELPIPQSLWFHFKYTVLELSTAVKPYVFEYLFANHGFDRIVYLDPDIRIYSPLHQAEEALRTANIVLTPHLTGAIEDGKRPAEIDILRSGAYNLGFIGIQKSQESTAFLLWWQQKLYDHCVVDLARGLFVDQKWLDLAPGMFAGVLILRDSGYNVAYWNLATRMITDDPDGYRAGGFPLVFFHFSGYDPEQPERLSRHQNRFEVKDLTPAAQDLLRAYRDELIESGYLKCRKWPYAFGTFKNGMRIPDLARPIHHESPELAATIEDPFSEAGFQASLDVWNAPVQPEDGGRAGVSRLAYRIYRTRTDVQSAMPDIFGGNYKRFLQWMLVSGRVEHGLGEVFLTTISDAIRTCKEHRQDVVWPEVPVTAQFVDVAMNGAATAGSDGVRLTKLAAAIYQSRPELQRYFPDPCGRNRARFLVWLLTYGKKEHHLSAAHLAPIREQWRSVLDELPGWTSRFRYQAILQAMAVSVNARGILSRLSFSVAQFRRLHRRPEPPPPVALQKHTDAVRESPLQFGVNLVGYFQSESGVGHCARGSHAALQSVSVPVYIRTAAGSGPNEEQDCDAGVFPYSTNLFHVNADQTETVRRVLGEESYRNRHNIAYWAWELDEFPARWLSAFAPYDEVWTLSGFCRNAIHRRAGVPVYCIPPAIAPAAPIAMDRSHFGLRSDRFTFLFAFDVRSVMDRKNPLAVIRAFELAFAGLSGCELVIKVSHAETRPSCLDTLRNACSSGAVRIIDATFSQEEMYGLIHCADCVVSLHRSEGFGLLIAEAMHFGKPVIVTNYSGNTDFTRPDNSLLVDYKLINVGRNCEPYDPLSQWADPDVEQAARHMADLVRNADLRKRLSHAGREFVTANFSPEAVGKMMLQRLEALQSRSGDLSAAPLGRTAFASGSAGPPGPDFPSEPAGLKPRVG